MSGYEFSGHTEYMYPILGSTRAIVGEACCTTSVLLLSNVLAFVYVYISLLLRGSLNLRLQFGKEDAHSPKGKYCLGNYSLDEKKIVVRLRLGGSAHLH